MKKKNNLIENNLDCSVKTAVIYARYSSNNQTEQSIEGQVHVCEDYAKRNNIIIVDSYVDRAMTGTNDNRDAFQKMLKDSNNHKWNYVIVYKLDRFARNKYESAVNKMYLKNNGVKLVSAVENIPETPEGILLESLLEGMNQYFSEELAQKVSRGLHESRMKGHVIGAVPFGYIKENKMLKINEEEALTIKQIYEEYVSGKTILQISREFEIKNITMKGRKLIPDTIRDILQRKTYTGIYELNGKTYNNIYPQIITLELYENAQKRLDLTRYGCRKDNHEIFRIKDKLYCGHCNRKMYTFSTISKNGNYLRYYKCISTRKFDKCFTKVMEKSFIEGVVDKFIKLQLNIPENLEQVTNIIYEKQKKLLRNKSTLNNIKSELSRANKSISNIMNAIEKGIFTDTTKSRLEELETLKKNLQEQLVIEESKVTNEFTKEEIKEFFQYAMKECPERAIELFIKFVKVYENKIEIGVNFSMPQQTEDVEQEISYLFTETEVKTRKVRGGKIITKTLTYDVYSVI